MSSPNQNSRDMQAWLARANASHFSPNPREFGEPGLADGSNTNQSNPSDSDVTGAGRDVSSPGTLDSDE
jgi:hypothetical protein